MKSEISALYVHTCPRCLRVQDRADPVECCDRVRSMLAVCQPSRRHLVSHPALPPGGQPPAWLSDAHAAPAGLPLPSVDDLASLATRRLWERLSAGTYPVTVKDSVALLRLAHDIEQDAGRPDPRWAATVSEILWACRKHLGDDGWKRFAADLRSNELLLDLWPRPDRS